MYSVLNEPGTTAKASHKFSWLFVQLHSAYLVCWTTHGWTDATASRQLATTLTDGDDNFWLAKRLIQDSARTTVCIWRVVATTASGTERLASYCQVESLFYDCQLPRTARSWPSAGSISVSRRERKALRLRHGSDSGLTAEMFRGWFSGLSMLKLILFQPKPTTTHYYSTLKIQKCNTGNGTVYIICPRTIVYEP